MKTTVRLPGEVQRIIALLREHGFDAYAVGGCVRDSILGKEPNDWDITTSASPARIKDIFHHTIDTGIEHGTVTVRMHRKSFEVTTYRIDGAYADARHPSSVTFTEDLKEDLRRRDFTINAMAYNDEAGLVDMFGGQEDLAAGVIRCVGDPGERFREDALRMLRAVRFCAQLGFSLDGETAAAIQRLADRLSCVSMERICAEMLKLLCSDHPEHIRLLYELGLSGVFFPEWNAMEETPQHTRHHRANVGEHTICVLREVSPTKTQRLAALFHDVGKPLCRKTDTKGSDHFAGHPQAGARLAECIMRRWKLDNVTMGRVKLLVRFHDERPALTGRNVRRCMNRVGSGLLPDLLELRRADVRGQSDYRREEKLAAVDDFERLYRQSLREQNAITVRDLKVGGTDLIRIGTPPGPMVGDLLRRLLELVWEEPSRNDKEFLLQRAQRMIGEGKEG